jgi:hypothetical protein
MPSVRGAGGRFVSTGTAKRPTKGKRQIGLRARFEIEGLKELQQQLSTLEKSVRKELLEKALLEGAEPVRSEFAQGVPRSDSAGGSRGKGHAADHIAKKAAKSRLRSTSGRFVSGSEAAEVQIGPEVDFWYITPLEFGVPSRGIPPHAMGRKAADKRFQDAVRKFKDVLAGDIQKALA